MERGQDYRWTVLTDVFRLIDEVMWSQEIKMMFSNKGFSFIDDSEEPNQGSSIRLDMQKDLTFHWMDNMNVLGSVYDFNKSKDSWEDHESISVSNEYTRVQHWNH